MQFYYAAAAIYNFVARLQYDTNHARHQLAGQHSAINNWAYGYGWFMLHGYCTSRLLRETPNTQKIYYLVLWVSCSSNNLLRDDRNLFKLKNTDRLCDKHAKMHTLPFSQKHIARSLRCSRTHHRNSSWIRSLNCRSAAKFAVISYILPEMGKCPYQIQSIISTNTFTLNLFSSKCNYLKHKRLCYGRGTARRACQ